jgi:hypothetical protein
VCWAIKIVARGWRSPSSTSRAQGRGRCRILEQRAKPRFAVKRWNPQVLLWIVATKREHVWSAAFSG